MRAFEIIDESRADLKMMLKLAGHWVTDIEREVQIAKSVYDGNPTLLNMHEAISVVANAKKSILDIVNLPF